jgi:hypothetical protein
MALQKTTSAPTTLSQEQRNLADDLIRCHGKVRIAREQRGLHFYIACPDCLQTDGEKELYSMHLAINVDKYLTGNTGAAQCMKTDKVFRIDELTFWPPLEKRGFRRGPERVADQSILALESCEQDKMGRWVPKGPGETVPLHTLPQDHPAIQYLVSRKFNVTDLENQFAAEFCVKERTDIKYRKLLGGFKASPQGRIIFYIYQNGERKGWQARILEMEDEKKLYYWQPYKERWIAVKRRETKTDPWELMEGWEDWDPAKYVMSHGAKRNQCLMGYDSARAFNAATRPKQRWCILLEGPLDAGRLGPPAIATCGKFCSQAQADILESSFDVIIVVRDNDVAGEKLLKYVKEWIGGKRKIVEATLPDRFHDAGMLSPPEAKIFRTIALQRAGLI